MRWFILQLVATASTLALALPPGTCSMLMHETQVEQASCCHPNPQKPAPHAPAERCCCAQDSTLPEKSVVAPVSLDLLLHLAIMPGVAEHGIVATGAPETFRPSGPRLHVLKCVWRC